MALRGHDVGNVLCIRVHHAEHFNLFLRLTLLDFLLDHIELENVLKDLGIDRLLQTLQHCPSWLNDSSDADLGLTRVTFADLVLCLLRASPLAKAGAKRVQ